MWEMVSTGGVAMAWGGLLEMEAVSGAEDDVISGVFELNSR